MLHRSGKSVTAALIMALLMLSCTSRESEDRSAPSTTSTVRPADSLQDGTTWIDAEQQRIVLLTAVNQQFAEHRTDEFWLDLAEQACGLALVDVSNEAFSELAERSGLTAISASELQALTFLRMLTGTACPEVNS